MGDDGFTWRTVLRAAGVAATAFAMPFVWRARAAGSVAPGRSMVLAWHTNIAPRWLDPQQHDGGATADNFLNVVQDALIKNSCSALSLGNCSVWLVLPGISRSSDP